ncbi:MAG: hypothetical protein ACRD2I_16115 [Vicinamibacterales bacterium]
MLTAVIVIGAAPMVPWIGVEDVAQALAVGTTWLGCTLLAPLCALAWRRQL